MANSEVVEDVDGADPFSDRQYGPRTRRRAQKEEEKVQSEHDRRVKKIEESISENLPTQTSFRTLTPTAFPSLDPGLSVKQNEEILQRRELEENAERENNPFLADENLYFTEDFDPAQGLALLSPRKLSRQEQHEIETASKARAARVSNRVVTVDLVKGKVVRWHQRATSEPLPSFASLDGSVHPETSGPSTPGLKSDSGSDSESESESESEEETPSYSSHTKHLKSEHPLLGEYIKRKLRGKMTENIAPTTSADDATRGLPYYERLKKTLKTSIKQKQELDETLSKIEQSIWNKEAAYLDDTVAGNIMKGFDNYIKASGAPGGAFMGGGTASRKKATVSEQDRLFSRSSVGFWNSMREGSPHASATSTPSHATTPKGHSDHPTPTSSTSTKAPGLKKKKGAEKDDESDSKPANKRLKITFSRPDKD